MKYWNWILVCLFAGVSTTAFAQVDVDDYVRKEEFRDMQLSPDGKYLAATLPLEDRTGMVILRLSDMAATAHFSLGRNTDIAGFSWANNERVLLGIAEKLGMLAEPQSTGEIFGVNANGKGAEILVGQRVQTTREASRLQPKTPERVWAELTDDLPNDDDNVLLTVGSFDDDAFTRAERMDVRNGRRVTVARAPVRRARFVTDHDGNVRFAAGAGSDNISKLYYRAVEGTDWDLVNDESQTGRREIPLGFSADGGIAYLKSDHPQGPDSIVAYEVASGERREVLRDDDVDPFEVIHASTGPREPIGAIFMDGKPRLAFFDPEHPEARLYGMLEQAFAGELVRITSRTADGRLAMVLVTSDRNSGDFFLFDTQKKSAERVASRREWLAPLEMGLVRPVSLEARDGLPLHGYVTLPKDSDGKGLPTIVLPHGGPYFVQDSWEFDGEAQMLAAAGYAVLRLNFRGSSGYGSAFEQAGARQWGRAMQDDLTDATRWMIAEGIADPGRICIYGASYGAYAAMMGVAREPSLYRCAAGYVGVYDLVMRQQALSGDARSLQTFAEQWMGEDVEALRSTSPTRLANQIKVPVFLAAGGEDEITPVEHTRTMEAALKQAGVPVESLYYRTEGHGFHLPANRREYYGRLLAFFDKHLGRPARGE